MIQPKAWTEADIIARATVRQNGDSIAVGLALLGDLLRDMGQEGAASPPARGIGESLTVQAETASWVLDRVTEQVDAMNGAMGKAGWGKP